MQKDEEAIARIFSIFFQAICSLNCTLLDLGCGTGIATKQLWDHGYHQITGCDIDPAMLDVAKSSCPETPFVQSDANSLPFTSSQFDCITAFACFHWFCHAKAIEEIKRVLKPEGLFVVINKDDATPIRREYLDWLSKTAEIEITNAKKDYRPAEILSQNNFKIVTEKQWENEDLYTLEEALSYYQSMSYWNQLSKEQQELVLPKLKKFLEAKLVDHSFVRPIKTSCIVGTSLMSSRK